MAEKAKAKKKDNKKLIACICCCCVVVIIAIVVAVIFATRGPQINDAYFETNDTKYVVTEEYGGDGVSTPIKTHYVYIHSGDKITSAAMYGEFKDEDAAKAALEEYGKSGEDTKNISRNGKYIVIEFDKDKFEGYTLEDIKAIYEYDYDYEEDEE